jgi:hypothetical protein
VGIILDTLKGIPLNAVLREQLSILEKEMAILKTKVATLEPENVDLKAKLHKIESDKTVHGDSCPYCQQPKGKLLDIRPDKTFGVVGVKIRYYKCEGCGKEYDKQQKPQ